MSHQINEQPKQRTDQQRKAIEVFCRNLAKTLNDAGLDQRAVIQHFKEGVEIPWSQDAVKDSIWRIIQQAMVKKESTVDLEPKEVSQVYEVVNRFTAENFGVSVPFPDRFNQSLENQYNTEKSEEACHG